MHSGRQWRQRAERGRQGTNPGRIADRELAREDLTDLACREAEHGTIHPAGSGAERHPRRCPHGSSSGLPVVVAAGPNGTHGSLATPVPCWSGLPDLGRRWPRSGISVLESSRPCSQRGFEAKADHAGLSTPAPATHRGSAATRMPRNCRDDACFRRRDRADGWVAVRIAGGQRRRMSRRCCTDHRRSNSVGSPGSSARRWAIKVT